MLTYCREGDDGVVHAVHEIPVLEVLEEERSNEDCGKTGKDPEGNETHLDGYLQDNGTKALTVCP